MHDRFIEQGRDRVTPRGRLLRHQKLLQARAAREGDQYRTVSGSLAFDELREIEDEAIRNEVRLPSAARRPAPMKEIRDQRTEQWSILTSDPDQVPRCTRDAFSAG